VLRTPYASDIPCCLLRTGVCSMLIKLLLQVMVESVSGRIL